MCGVVSADKSVSSDTLRSLASPPVVSVRPSFYFRFLWGCHTGGSVCDLPSSRPFLTQGSSGPFSPLKRKKPRTENDFVKFDQTPFLPKPLFCRKVKSSTSPASGSLTVQVYARAPCRTGPGRTAAPVHARGVLLEEPGLLLCSHPKGLVRVLQVWS